MFFIYFFLQCNPGYKVSAFLFGRVHKGGQFAAIEERNDLQWSLGLWSGIPTEGKETPPA